MLWSDWVTAIAAELAMTSYITNAALATPSSNTDFNNILPRAVEYTELTMLRDPDLDFLAVRTYDATTSCTPSNRQMAIPAAIIVPIDLSLISPAATTPALGTRNRVQRVSPTFIDMLYSTEAAGTGLPSYYAVSDNNQSSGLALQVRFGPAPDAAYVAEWYGQYRPAALSATNTANFLSVNLPDLYLAKSMVFLSGYIRNFGAQADDPKMALSWTMVYEQAKQGAAVEEARRKAESVGWTAHAATRSASPPRM